MSSLGETFVTKSYVKGVRKMDKGTGKKKRPNMTKVAKARMASEGPKRSRAKNPKVVSYPPPMKPKRKAPMRETAAKPVKKASEGSRANLARAGELQRREMARTRLQKPDRMAAAAARKKAVSRAREMENQRKDQKMQMRLDKFNRRYGR